MKILYYILDNQVVAGKEAISFFNGKLQDPLLLANLKRTGQTPADVVLFG